MSLATKYLGLPLRTPFVVGASPFCDNPAVCQQLEALGAGALVMHSLFAEQMVAEQRALFHHTETPGESHAEAMSYFPRHEEYRLGPEQYLQQIRRLKRLLRIPVIASLNGAHRGDWTDYARPIEAAGADALELNFYQLVTHPAQNGEDVEEEMIAIVHEVTREVKIPVAVKLSPFHTALPHFARELERAGASGLVLFNRFYQPDFNIEDFEVVPALKLSDPSELLLRLRWLSILSPEVQGSLACSGGVHYAEDAIKAILAGAHAVQVVSSLLRQGPGHLGVLMQGLNAWMQEHGYQSVADFRGAMNLRRCPDPAQHERANYIRILQSWRV